MDIVSNLNQSLTNKNKRTNQFTHPWKKREINFVQNNIHVLTYKQMQEVIHRTPASIQSKVRYLPLKQKVKKYKINSNFFKKWSQEMAYTLGFIATDGNIYKNRRAHMLQIASDDKDVIAKIKLAMSADAPILERKRFNGKISYQFRVSDIPIFNDLLKLNITPHKSLTLKPSNVPKKYLNHYLRGIFDGDGSVMTGKTSKLISVLYTASPKMSHYLFKHIRNICPQFRGKIQKLKRQHNYYSISVGHRDSKLLYKFMYQNARIFMDRKHNKFLENIHA